MRLVIGLMAGAALTILDVAPAAAIGYWNMPGTFCQCFGCGWGAGYHAPLVLGPMSCEGFCGPDVVRLPSSPSAPHGWQASHSLHDGPMPSPMFAPSVLSPATANPTPVPAAYRGPILR